MIEAILAKYRLRRDVQESTVEHYRWVLQSFQRYLGHEISPQDWREDVINGFLSSLRYSHSVWTVKQRRVSLLVMWRAAFSLGLSPEEPAKLRNVKTPDRVISTWTPQEVSRLIHFCEQLEGRFRNTDIPRWIYWSSWVRVAYDTGLRQSDIFLLEAVDVLNTGGRLTIIQKKTGFVVRVSMRPETLVACRRLSTFVSRYLFPRIWTGNHFCHAFARIVRAAGLKGTATTMRQTSCTEVERLQPGFGWIHLGHRSPTTALSWYIDRDRAHSNRPLPPLPPPDREVLAKVFTL